MSSSANCIKEFPRPRALYLEKLETLTTVARRPQRSKTRLLDLRSRGEHYRAISALRVVQPSKCDLCGNLTWLRNVMGTLEELAFSSMMVSSIFSLRADSTNCCLLYLSSGWSLTIRSTSFIIERGIRIGTLSCSLTTGSLRLVSRKRSSSFPSGCGFLLLGLYHGCCTYALCNLPPQLEDTRQSGAWERPVHSAERASQENAHAKPKELAGT